MIISSTILRQTGPEKKRKWVPSYLKSINLSNKKRNILLLYDSPYWAYANECFELRSRAPKNICVYTSNKYDFLKFSKFDLVVQMAYGNITRLLKYLELNKLNVPVVSTYTVGKGYNDDSLKELYKYCNNIIINNLGMYEEFGKKPGTIYIPNGVNTIFYHNKRKQRKNKVIFIGSEYHRKVKSYDDILLPLKERLEKKNIECDFKIIDNTRKENILSKYQLLDWYNESKVYIVASKSEGTPNPALEAAACGCTIVSTKVGNMPELIKDGVNGYFIDYDLDNIENKVISAIENYSTLSLNIQKDIKDWDWGMMSKKFYRYFLEVMK